MLNRVRNKFTREVRRYRRARTPYQSDTTFGDGATPDWYFGPLLATPATLRPYCHSVETINGVAGILRKLTPDPFIATNLAFYEAGLTRFGDGWQYADLTTVLYGVCRVVQVRSYLEIGVLRGRSMAVVASLHPQSKIVGFDRWLAGYAGVSNPGPAFVADEMTRVGHTGTLELIEGDSAQSVPKYFEQNPDLFFDVITVDGAHTARAAVRDLRMTIPRLKVGGVLIFDDICNPEHPWLAGVWRREVASSPRFVATSFEETGHGVAFAMKKY